MPGKKKRKEKNLFTTNSVDSIKVCENNLEKHTQRKSSIPLVQSTGQTYNINNNGIGNGRKHYKRLTSENEALLTPNEASCTHSGAARSKRGSTESWESIGNCGGEMSKQVSAEMDCDIRLPAEYILMENNIHNKRRVSSHRLSYRKAIQKAGYNMNELVISTSGAMSPVAQRRTEPKAELDWTENALPNDHIWAPTNASGDLCYVGEQTCLKSGPRKKCSACHIVVHDQCMPLLERIGFQCKVTFRESTSRSMRENLTVHHHWVHRRKQEGKCKQCSKSFDKRFGFRDTKIIAISCSWCKEAFHNKVSCFQIHKINEPCGLGMFFRSIVPPTWIVKASTKQKSIRNRSKKKRGSTGNWRKKSSKELKQRTFVVRPPSQQSAFITPILVFINPKSGGNQGAKLMQSFQWVMNPRQVVDLTKGGPQEALELYKKVPNLRILACGGDGTVGWILSVLDKLGISRPPPVAILPLGTGNDLSRTLNFGPGYTDESIQKIIQGVEEGRVVKLDRWKLHVERNECEQRINEEEIPCEESKATDKPPLDVVNNYFSIGSDAKVSLNFHESREAKPNKFNSRIGNKIFYAKAGVSEYLTRQSKDMFKHITVVCDGKDITPKIRELKPVCMLFLNINRYSSGTTPWGHPTGTEFQAQRHDDKLIEVLAFSLNQLGMLFVGGHGERLCQCKSAYIKTDKTLPIQIDGEPCRLNPSNIRIEFFNQASMVYKTKRRPSVNPEHQQIKIRVNAVSSAQYDEYSGRTDKLCNIATPRLVTIVSNNSTLSSVRSSWEAVNPCERGPGVASEKWMFLDASRPDKLYLIDRTQENLHLICDVITTDREIYLMDMTESKTNTATHSQVTSAQRLRGGQADRRSVQFRSRIHSDSGVVRGSIDSVASDMSQSLQDVRSSTNDANDSETLDSRSLDVVFESNFEDAEKPKPHHLDKSSSEEKVRIDPEEDLTLEDLEEITNLGEDGLTMPPCGSNVAKVDSEQPNSNNSSPLIRQVAQCETDSSYSTSSNEYLITDDNIDTTVARHKSVMTQRSGPRKKLLRPCHSNPPPNGGVLLGDFINQRDGSPKGKVPIRRSSSSGSKREETSSTENPVLLSNFVKGLRFNNNQSNNILSNPDLSQMWSKMFMDASKRGDVKKMCLAYEHGADLFIRDHDGSTALHHAARFSHLQVVQFMIEHGKTKVVNLLDNDRKQTALHKAAWYGRLDICRELVEAGASLAFTDYKGKTAIDRAKQSDSPDLVQYLTNAHHTANALNNCLETDL
uniref:diacylglycerol kinase zeta-like isoform X1 n=1 Tax=Ciona intestinalis TaxID=7719 RepID=UPI0002B8D76E|nr:diacylglycerol kinase zeta-like isoform X1 [Ciona intestinalis]|eukprot:XP_002121503.2 diacylglycerol kinase zeta-like isoform X1 [Ciona intestinalis]